MHSLCSRLSEHCPTLTGTVAGEKAAVTSVLLVDDDPQILRAILPALEVSGLHVTVTTTGEEAINKVDSGGWDALIVDLGLPDMDGKTIIRHLRGKSATPVVVISAQHSREEVDAAHRVGANFFFHKPFRTPDLVECIRVLIAQGGIRPVLD
jgi:two-component system KDP operon response regulator KdpE